jgi:hypothetical protein
VGAGPGQSNQEKCDRAGDEELTQLDHGHSASMEDSAPVIREGRTTCPYWARPDDD